MAAVLGEKEAGEETNEKTEKARVDEDEDDHSTEKRGRHSKKHKHKHSKKHKHKHKKRRHKKRSSTRSRSKSSSRSRSKSPDSDGENPEEAPAEADTKVAPSEENGTGNQESENKTIGLDDTEDLPFGWFPETEDSASEEITNVGTVDLSFKLTKSPPPNVSPTSTPTNEAEVLKAVAKAPDAPKLENKVNLGFPLKIGSFAKSRCKSPDVSKATVKDKKSGAPSDPKIKGRSSSPSDPGIKKRSRSPSDPKRSKSPSGVKTRKRSRSRSRSRMKARKSRSKTPKEYSKKKSRSSMSSRSSSRSRSRSPQKHKHRSRSRSRSSSYSRKKSRRRERSHSRSRKSRSRSPRKKSRGSYYNKNRSRSRSRSPSYRDRRNKRDTSYDRKREYYSRSRRSRSYEKKNSRRSRSVTPSRSNRHRSPSRSPRRGRSRSPKRDRYRYRSRSRSRSQRYRRRSRSRSPYSARRKKSRSSSRSRDQHYRRSRSKSKEKNDSEENKVVKSEEPTEISNTNTNKPTAQDLVGKAPTISDPSNKRSLAELTEFCKKLTEARGIETEGNGVEVQKEEEEEDISVEISHPFLVAPKKDITIPSVLLPPFKLPPPPLVASDKPLTEQFPVSCGTKHHEKEQEVYNVGQIIPDVDGSVQQVQQVFMPPQNREKLDISGLVVKRMEAQRRLQANPNDVDAMLSLQEVEMKLNSWCQSNVKPGQFTGQLAKTMMPKEKMNSGYQAWAKKDMFHNLNPVSGGIGMKLLQKMGWEPGQVLGKRGQGMVEPIALTVKVDRKGLSSNTEKPVGKKGGGNKPVVDLQGKHPISTLQEYCARRKWQVPEFTLIFDEGPPHSKQFLFKVAVNGYEYQHPVVSSNKKHAKAQAAVAALKGLGLVPEDTEY